MTTAQMAISDDKARSGPKPSRLGTEWQKQKARHAAAMAEKIEMQNKITRGEHVPRDAVRRASATALATLAQHLRNLPDALERNFALPGDVVEEVGNTIDAALNDCADAFEKFTK